ncbi:MAG: hypothetical protein PHU12_01140 [Candidatus Aenigmarchaeota archaeon]|nr:hypothetical protein [Candidatus Aenigmarchaeota archaeon]
MALSFPPPLYQEIIIILTLLVLVFAMSYSITSYRRFTKGDFKKCLFYYILAGNFVGISFIVRSLGLITNIEPVFFRTIDHIIYAFAIVIALYAVWNTYQISNRYSIDKRRKL